MYVYVCIMQACMCVCMHISYIHTYMMHVCIQLHFYKINFLFFKGFSEGICVPPRFANDHNIQRNWSFKIIICDILFMRSHEARPSTVSSRLVLLVTVNTAVPQSKLWRDSPFLPPMICAPAYPDSFPSPWLFPRLNSKHHPPFPSNSLPTTLFNLNPRICESQRYNLDIA